MAGCDFIEQQISHHRGNVVTKALFILVPALFMQLRPREIILAECFLKGGNGPTFVTFMTRVGTGSNLTFHLRGNLSGGTDINLRPVTNTDGSFAALPEVAQEKFLCAFPFTNQTLEPADFAVTVFSFTGRGIGFIRG